MADLSDRGYEKVLRHGRKLNCDTAHLHNDTNVHDNDTSTHNELLQSPFRVGSVLDESCSHYFLGQGRF